MEQIDGFLQSLNQQTRNSNSLDKQVKFEICQYFSAAVALRIAHMPKSSTAEKLAGRQATLADLVEKYQLQTQQQANQQRDLIEAVKCLKEQIECHVSLIRQVRDSNHNQIQRDLKDLKDSFDSTAFETFFM